MGEQLSCYRYDLTPVELIWGNHKSNEVAKRCIDITDEASVFAEDGLSRIRAADFWFAFLRHFELKL